MVKFKDFSRPLSVFPVLFKTYLILKDFSRKPSKFKYFSRLCEPSSHAKTQNFKTRLVPYDIESNICANLLLNILNPLSKSDIMLGKPRILSLLPNFLSKFNKT